MKKVIITGPTGVIGIALVQILLEKNIEVTAVCHRNSHKICHLPVSEKLKIVECNLNEITMLANRLQGEYDTFFHFAWECTFGESRNNIEIQMKNIQYTLAAVETAQKLGCTRFIGAGSQAECGRCESLLNAETPTFPENAYGIAKLCAGQLSRLRCAQLGMDHIWTRILSVYGPYDGDNTMIISLIRKLLHKERPQCTQGEQIWDYIYSKDAAKAFYMIGKKGCSNKIYYIGSGTALALKEYINIIKNQINEKAEIGFGDIEYSEKQVMFLQADISELSQDTGFKTDYSFEEGIFETIQWMKQVDKKVGI